MIRQLLAAILSLLAAPALADSWRPASVETTYSPNGMFRVTVVPRPIGGALPYFRDKVDGIEPAGQAPGNPQRSPMASVERKLASGDWELVWQAPLTNDVAPVSVVLSVDGRRLVTFDNWHSVGLGDDMVVIYGGSGELIRKYSLEQLLPEPYPRHLPRSVSSRRWSSEKTLLPDGQTLEIQLLPPGYTFGTDNAGPSLHLRLEDGSVSRPGHWGWLRAVVDANALEWRRLEAWKRLRERRSQPLSAPDTTDARDWRAYADELLSRARRPGERIGAMVLGRSGEAPARDNGHEIWNAIARADVANRYESGGFLLASPHPERLADVVTRALAAKAPGSLSGVRILFVGSPDPAGRLAQAAAHAGVDLAFIDPREPYPPGRTLPESPDPHWMPRALP